MIADLQDVDFDAVPKTHAEAVRLLAAMHASGDDSIEVYEVPDPHERVVRLAEVSETFPEGGVDRPTSPEEYERVIPVYPFGPSDDFPFRSEVVQVRPEEWEALQAGRLRLTRPWDLASARLVVGGGS